MNADKHRDGFRDRIGITEMSFVRRFSAASVCVVMFALPAIPQQGQPVPTFGSTTTEVIVPVTVTDDKGKFVSNLEAKDFRVLDEGKPQKLKFFSHNERQPIVVGFLVDMSNSSKIHWKT